MRENSISSVTLGYANSKLLKLLMLRGKAIQNNDQTTVEKREKQINKLVKSDIEKMKRPVVAFVTFTRQESMERCLKYF